MTRLLTIALILPACAPLLQDLPPQTSVCVTVSAWGLSAQACGYNNEPVEQIKARAVAIARQRAGMKAP